MSEGLKEAKKGDDHRKKMSFLTQSQHSKQKFGRFKDVTVEESKIDQYLHVRKCHRTDTEYVVVIIKKAKTSFVGKTEKIEDITPSRIVNARGNVAFALCTNRNAH